MKLQLRLLDKPENYNILDLPVIFEGTKSVCKDHALKLGYFWHPDVENLFEGYFVHENGNCLFLT